MAVNFAETERAIIDLLNKDKSFYYGGEKYEISYAAKPCSSRGEPKADIFILAVDPKGDNKKFKISVKQDNADFYENKMSAETAESIFGADWKNIIIASTKSIKENFASRHLIYKNKCGRTEKGALTLGWKFELLNVKSGHLSGSMVMSCEQKKAVLRGDNLTPDKRDAYVNGNRVSNSGVADYLLNCSTTLNSTSDIFNELVPLDDSFPYDSFNFYFACKALNYRMLKDKWDGNRPLSVYVDWEVEEGKLKANLNFDNPLVTKGNSIGSKLKESLGIIGVNNISQVSPEVVTNYHDIVCE